MSGHLKYDGFSVFRLKLALVYLPVSRSICFEISEVGVRRRKHICRHQLPRYEGLEKLPKELKNIVQYRTSQDQAM